MFSRSAPSCHFVPFLVALACSEGGSPAPAPGGPVIAEPCTLEPPTAAEEAADGAAHWAPGTITSFEIFHFEGLNEFRQGLKPVEVVTLELDQVEGAGGRAVTDAAHAQDTRVICYTSAGFEDWRADAASYPAEAKGSNICQNDACTRTWPGEAWGDIRSASLLAFLGTRADRAVAIGCDGIEFDNMDPAFNRTGLDMSPEENATAALGLARLGHERGLGVFAKNTGELACSLAAGFDGVYVEECEEYGECDVYLPYRGKLVAMVEYGGACRQREWAACNEQGDYFDAEGR